MENTNNPTSVEVSMLDKNVAPTELSAPAKNTAQTGINMPGRNATAAELSAPAYTSPVSTNKAFLIVDYIFWIMVAVILLRFAFKLIGANPENAFVTLIYNFTNPTVTVFQGIVGDVASGAMIIEFSSLISIVVLWLIYKAILRLITIMK